MKKQLLYSLTAIGLLMSSEAFGEEQSIPRGYVPCPKGENINVGMLCAGKSFTVKYKTTEGDITEELWKLHDKSPDQGVGTLRFISKKNRLKAKHETDGETCRYVYATLGGGLREVWLVPATKAVGIWGNEDTKFTLGKGRAKTPEPEPLKEDVPEVCPAPPAPPPPPTDLATVNFPPPPPPMPSGDSGKKEDMPKAQSGRNDLLADIRKGTGLKKVDKKERKKPMNDATANAMASAMDARRKQMRLDDDE